MRRIILLLLLFIISGAASLQSKRNDYLSSFRIAPILPASVENTVIKSTSASVVYFDTISDSIHQKHLLDYDYSLKIELKKARYTLLSRQLLSENTFIKSDYSVAMPFLPQVGVLINDGPSSVVFLLSFQSSTARIYQNGIKVEELLIADPSSLLFLFKLILN